MAVVYSHNKPCGEVFYVGVGKALKRAYATKCRTKYWKRIVEKYGYEIKIVREGISDIEAREIEIFMIDFYGRRDLGKGTLCNLTDGGEGTFGLIYTKEHKDNIRKALKGKPHTEERKLKTKETNRAAEFCGRKVICVDTLKTWDTIVACQKELKISSLAVFLHPTNDVKNSTSIQYFDDYENGIITCKQQVKPHKIKVLNVTTGKLYNSSTEAGKDNIGANRDTIRKHFKTSNEFTTQSGITLKLVTN